jgi:Phage tail tube protein FII
MSRIPETINAFNVYKDGAQLIGVTAEVTLPDFTAMTDTISGAGLMGEYETVITGAFSSMTIDIPFRTLNDDTFKLLSPTQALSLTLRGSIQNTNKNNLAMEYTGMRVVVTGRAKAIKPGTLKPGQQMNSSIAIEVMQILIEIDGKKKIELDKLNAVYKVDGKDLLAQIKSQC